MLRTGTVTYSVPYRVLIRAPESLGPLILFVVFGTMSDDEKFRVGFFIITNTGVLEGNKRRMILGRFRVLTTVNGKLFDTLDILGRPCGCHERPVV